ncbi:MAG: RNA polymerase sigma factor [Victivallales bacterium]|nr:RNA polymerase sigma factor [Victivallales bacterium]MBT7161581.1 RNA polymerase sigma factor [Victivallales bacterium]MBT7301780.1 RNA polymerase sigma factor [Victivallales bacterium]
MPAQTSASGLLAGQDALDRLSEATDKRLVKWMCDGDTTAFEELFRRYETRLISYAARYIGSIDLAKDVCQEVFLKLISKPPRVLICDSVGPWLFRVTRNLAIDKRRRRKFEIQEEDNEMPEARAEGTPLTTLAAQDDLHMIRELVEELPKDIRDVVELRIDGRVPFKDIAVILGIPQGTALWRMHRAVQLMRQRWKTYEAQV